MAEDATRVAIGCQGGGSHTAFTAGVLKYLLREDDGRLSGYDLVALSGTSGGAVNAAATWYGIHAGGSERAIETLDGVWNDFSARTAADRLANRWTHWSAAILERGVPVPRVSPYDLPFTEPGRDRFLDTLRRRIDFGAAVEDREMDLIVGAADVEDGEFATFHNGEVTPEAILASAAYPALFEAVEIDGHWYWDGLFSQNPPIREFLTLPDRAAAKPDEIWIVRINPRSRDELPTALEEIADRRNELAGNLSLHQEIGFIRQVNEWLEEGSLSGEFKPVDVEFIDLGLELSTASKLNRDPAFVDRLMDRGERRAAEFLDEELNV